MKKLLPLSIVTILTLSSVNLFAMPAFSNEAKKDEKKGDKKVSEEKTKHKAGKLKEIKTKLETKYPVKIPTFEGKHWDAGNDFFDKGMYKEAYHEYFMSTRLNPSFWQGFKGIGDVYLNQGSTEKTINNYLKAISIINPTYAQKTLDDAQVSLKEGDYYLAIAKFRKVLAIDPDAGNLVNEAVELLKNGKKSQAEKKLQEAVKIDESLNQYDRKTLTYADAHFKLGTMMYEKKKYEDAQKEFEKSVKIDPSEPAYNYALGNAYYKIAYKNKKNLDSKLLNKAIVSYQQAYKLSPRDPELMYNLAVAKISQASIYQKTVFDKEEQIFKEVEGDPKAKKKPTVATPNKKAKEAPQEKFNLQAKFAKDIKVQKLSDESSKNATIASNISKEAVSLLEKVTILTPMDPKAYSYLGDAYVMMGGKKPLTYINAARAYQIAIDLDSSMSDLYAKMGTSFYLASKIIPDSGDLPITRENAKLYNKFGKPFYRADMLESASNSFNSFLRYSTKASKFASVRSYLATVNNDIANLGFRIPDKSTGR